MAGPGGEQIGQGYVAVGIDDSGLDRGLRESEAKVRDAFTRIDKQRARPEIEAETREVSEAIGHVRESLLMLDKMKADPEIDADGVAAAIAQTKLLQLKLKELTLQKYRLTLETGQIRDAEKDLGRATHALNDFQKSQEREVRLARQQSVEIARLRDRYATLSLQQKKFSKFPITSRERVALERINAEMSATSARLRELGSDVVHVNEREDRQIATLRNWLHSIGAVRLQMGFFSASIRQVGVGLITLGPIVEGIIGLLGSLIGSLGSALLGAASVGGAGLVFFAGSALGIVTALKPATAQLGNAMTAFKAYNDAVIKYGKNSTQAETAQSNLNNTLKNSPKDVTAAARAVTELSSRWQKLTEPTRARFFELVTDSMGKLNTLLPAFATQTNKTFDVMADGADNWVNTLAGPEVQRALTNIMSNFRSALPDIMGGIRDLAVALLNTFSAASNRAREFTGTFKDWAADVRTFTEDNGFQDTVDGWIHSTHEWFGLLAATGRLLTTVFAGGVKTGDNVVKDFTKTLNSWNRSLETPKGQEGLASWFERTSATAEKFFSALLPLVTLFGKIAEAANPLIGPVLTGIRGFLNILGMIPGPVLTAAGAMFAFYRAASLVRAVWTFFMGASAASGAVGLFGRIASSAAPAAAGLTLMADETTALGGAAGVALGPLGILAAGIGGPLVAVMAQNADEQERWNKALTVWGDRADKLQGPGGAFRQTLEDTADAITNASDALDNLEKHHNAAKAAAAAERDVTQSLNDKIEKYGRNSLQVAIAEDRQARAHAQTMKERRAAAKDSETAVHALNGSISEQRDKVNELRKSEHAEGAESRLQSLAAARASRAGGAQLDVDQHRTEARIQSEKILTGLLQRRAFNEINVGRIMSDNKRISDQYATSVGKFAQAFRGVPAVKKFLVQTNSRQAVQQVSQVGNRLNNLGQKKAVVTILGDSKNAEQAFKRLKNLLDNVKQARAQVHVEETGADDVIHKLQRILNVRLTPKSQKIAENGAADVLGVLSGIFRVNLPPKTQKIVQAGASSVFSVLARLAATTLSPITQYINQVTRKQGAEGMVVARATGGDTEYAAARALRNRGVPMDRSAKVSKPTFLTGEEPSHPEYVIATNPAYRRANLGFLAAAAKELGATVIAPFASGGLLPNAHYRGMTGTQSKYAAYHNQIQLSEQTFGNMQRHYQDQLALGVQYPTPSLSQVGDQKQRSINLVDKLIDLITGSLLPKIGKRINKTHPKPHYGDRPKKHHGESTHDYQRRVHEWEQHKKQAIKAAKDKAHERKTSLRDQKFDLKNEVATLKQDRYNYELDLASLLAGDSGGGSGGSSGPTLAEQFATFNQSRYDLYRNFGGNFNPIDAAIPQGFGAGGGTAPFAFSQGGGGSGSAPDQTPGKTTTVNQTINMNEPSDPHLFTQALAWEAQGV